jgi:hypothetical protein
MAVVVPFRELVIDVLAQNAAITNGVLGRLLSVVDHDIVAFNLDLADPNLAECGFACWTRRYRVAAPRNACREELSLRIPPVC